MRRGGAVGEGEGVCGGEKGVVWGSGGCCRDGIKVLVGVVGDGAGGVRAGVHDTA